MWLCVYIHLYSTHIHNFTELREQRPSRTSTTSASSQAWIGLSFKHIQGNGRCEVARSMHGGICCSCGTCRIREGTMSRMYACMLCVHASVCVFVCVNVCVFIWETFAWRSLPLFRHLSNEKRYYAPHYMQAYIHTHTHAHT